MDDDRTIIRPSSTRDLEGDQTVLFQTGLKVSLFEGDGTHPKSYFFSKDFTVGRAVDNNVVISSQLASRYHLKVSLEKGIWWVEDLNSANGIYIDQILVKAKTRLILPVKITIGRSHIFLNIEGVGLNMQNLSQDDEVPNSLIKPISQTNGEHRNLSKEQLKSRLLADNESHDLGEYTKIVRSIIHEDRSARKKSYKKIIGGLSLVLFISIAMVIYQQLSLTKVRNLAVEMYYDIKTLEVSLSQAEMKLQENEALFDLTLKAIVKEKLGTDQERIRVEQEKIAAERKRLMLERQKLAGMKEKYRHYVDEAKSLRIRLPTNALYEEELIAKVARGFGESELELPQGFIAEVKRYVEYWQKSSRLQQAMRHLEKNGYQSLIADALEKEGLPLYFMYLPLQESNYDTHAIGPETRFGIAKGAWQFLATTAKDYGLAIGPLAHTRQFDLQDERFDFDKATRAGIKHLKRIYSTEAQASGLLVMASYNYGHTRMRGLISKMQENPRERNFWKFIQQNNLPRETYDYVFYIFSAAVIGEDPKHFGFHFNPPFEYLR